MALLWQQAGLAAPDRWISVDKGWIKLGHIRGDVLGPFPGSGMAIGGRQWALKTSQKGHIWPFRGHKQA